MYEVTRTYKVYPFNELPEKLKDKARDQFRNDLVNQALSDAQDSGEDYEVLRAGFYMVLMQTIIDKMRELGVEEDAIVMGIKAVLHGDDFKNAEPDENQIWQ